MPLKTTDVKRGFTEYIPTFKKPKPKVEKINFSAEDKEQIKGVLEGKPTKALMDYWLKKRTQEEIKMKIKWFRPPPLNQRIDDYVKKHELGRCQKCGMIPDYKLMYQFEGITLREWFCSEHLPEEFKQ